MISTTVMFHACIFNIIKDFTVFRAQLENKILAVSRNILFSKFSGANMLISPRRIKHTVFPFGLIMFRVNQTNAQQFNTYCCHELKNKSFLSRCWYIFIIVIESLPEIRDKMAAIAACAQWTLYIYIYIWNANSQS